MPQLRETSTTNDKMILKNNIKRAEKLKPTVTQIPPDVLVTTMELLSKDMKLKEGEDAVTYLDQLMEAPQMKSLRKEMISMAIAKVTGTWDASMEADIKLITCRGLR